MERVSVGDVEVIALADCLMTYPASSVYTQAGDELQRYSAYLTEDGGLEMNCACFLLRADGATVLVDTGMGPEQDGRLMAELAEAGVAPGEVEIVIFTHPHGDHTGWNIDRESGQPNFPNARYLVSRPDWEQEREGETPSASFARDLEPLEALGCLELIDLEHRLTDSLVATPTPGHTPGHLGVAISSGGEQGFLWGDALLSALDVEEPDWTNSYDGDSDTARQTRHTLLERVEADSALVGAAHLPPPSLGRIVRVEGRRVWRAVASGR